MLSLPGFSTNNSQTITINMKVTPKKLSKAIEKSTKSNAVKSTRRLFFVASDDPEPLSFKADHFGGMGTATLIKTDGKYFYLKPIM